MQKFLQMRIEEEIKQQKFENEYQKLMINLLFSGKWVTDFTNHFLKEYDISSQQFNVLRILRGQHPKAATVNLISDRMIDKMSNVSRLIDKLENKKLVERKVCKKDRRQVDILISSEGLQLLKRIDESDNQLESNMKNLSSKEATQLNDLLDKLRS